MKDLHPELHTVLSALHLEEDPRKRLFEAVAEMRKSPYAALQLLWLVENLRGGTTSALILLQKKELLENLINLFRQGLKACVGRVCHLLYEGGRPQQKCGSLLPAGMIRDLLQWVKEEKAEKIREILWAVLLQKGVGLEGVAKVADLAPALCEPDPITRNNAVRFLLDHFSPGEVFETLFRFSMTSGRSVPGVAYRRYVSLLNAQGALVGNKDLVRGILDNPTLEDRDIQGIFVDYVNSLNRFDLVRLFSSPDTALPRLAALRHQGG